MLFFKIKEEELFGKSSLGARGLRLFDGGLGFDSLLAEGAIVELASHDDRVEDFAFGLRTLAEVLTDGLGVDAGDLGSSSAGREIILHVFFLLRKIYFI